MSVTTSYTRAHDAFRNAGARLSIQPFGARLLVALMECGNHVRTDTLAAHLSANEAMVRRAKSALVQRGLIAARAIDGGPTRQGLRDVYSLTDAGRVEARKVADDASA